VCGRAEVVGPVAGAPGERDLTEDEFDQAVEQRVQGDLNTDPAIRVGPG